MAQEAVVLKTRGTGKGAARACRRASLVPAVIYGRSTSPIAVAVDVPGARKMMTGIGTQIHHVTIEGTDFEGDIMVQEAVFEPVSRRPIHFDLHKISLTEKVRTDVPVVVTGEAILEKTGLILQRQLRQISVECLPTDIPQSFSIDVSGLGHGDAVSAGQIPLPEGVRLVTLPTEVVVVAVAPRQVEEPTEAGEAAEGEAAEGAETAEKPGKTEKPE